MENDTPNLSALFVFGDSLSDNGAIFAVTGGTFPPLELTGTDADGNDVDFAGRGVFYNQNFTNGDVFPDVTAGLLGIASDTTTFYDDFSGSNFAVGGATATDLSTFGGTANNTLADQVGAFLASLDAFPGTDTEKAALLGSSAASILIGLNDLGPLGDSAATASGFDPFVLGEGVAIIVAEIEAQARALAEAGLGTIILNKLPSTAFFPSTNDIITAFGPQVIPLLDAVSTQINLGLETIAAALEAEGTATEMVDLYGLAQEVEADAETFGFLTLENALPNSDAENTLLITDVPIDQVGFIDPVHPTAELHEVIGAFQATTLGNTELAGSTDGGITQGSAAHETVFAQAGRDRVRAEDGDDLVFGGADNDVVFGGAGDDIVFGGTDNDVLFGDTDNDILSGGSGNDILLGASGDDVIAGNAGNDYLDGGEGSDVLIDGLGNDVIFGNVGDDFAIYRAASTLGGTDGQDSDTFFGGTGTDTLLIVSDTAIDDVDAFLTANNVQLFGFEATEVVTSDELESYDFGTVGTQVEMADLFGLV